MADLRVAYVIAQPVATPAPRRFSAPTRQLLLSQPTTLFLSAASVWEIAIKHGLGRLALPERPSD
jgi:PIN domain nuclease of toxin-antitoxin system